MPQVASQATQPAFNPAPPTLARPTPGSDSAADLPFESLLDDSTQAAAPPPPQAQQAPQAPQAPPAAGDRTTESSTDSAADKTDGKTADRTASKPEGTAAGKTAGKAADKTAIPAQPDPTEPLPDPNAADVAKTGGKITVAKAPDDGKAAQAPVQTVVQAATQTVDDAKIADAANAAAVAAAPAASTIPGNTRVKIDAKLVENTKTADTSKSADDGKHTGDSKSADVPAPAVLAADPTKNPVQTVVPAVVVAPAPAPTAVIPQAIGRELLTAPVATQVAIAATDAPKPKAPNLAAAQDGIEKLAAAKDGTNKFAAAHPHDEDLAAAPRSPAQTPPSIATDAHANAPKSAGDAVQQAALTPPSPDVLPAPANPTVPTAPAAPTAPSPPAAAVPIAGLAIEIASQAQAGNNHFDIRLDPPELGRIDVRLDVDRDGQVTSHLTADRPDTLTCCATSRGSASARCRMPGLKPPTTACNSRCAISALADQQQRRPASRPPRSSSSSDNLLPAATEPTQLLPPRRISRGGIDIRV